jgi:Domain of Unknown Function (DUF1080)
MKKQTLLFAGMILTAAFLSSYAEKQNGISVQEKQDGWKLLFDGQSLAGWKNYNEPGISKWSVEDGCLAASGTGSDSTGYIITEKQYDNFELNFEWKISKGGNSGVIYHVMEGKKFRTPYVTGPEYQVLDKTGRLAAGRSRLCHAYCRCKNQKAKPGGRLEFFQNHCQ